jgi:hypothetical protein
MKENINALDEIHKGACMGVDALNDIIDKVEDKNLVSVLKEHLNDYKAIVKRIETVYNKYDDDKPHETNIITKAMTWSSVEMETLADRSNSNIAEYLLRGVNMGVIEGRKILNKKHIDKEVHNIVSEYVTMQEKHVEVLKTFL